MPPILRIVAILALSVGLISSERWQADSDEVTSLPGLKYTPNFKHYSGYLNASDSGDKQFHYWFVESQNDPAKDPLVLWLNGGPGCSSLDGFLSELGPFHVNDDGMTLYENKYSWNLVANVLFLESPAGVGFSYATDKNYTSNDDLTAEQNYKALQSFFVKYPQFKANDFYITGESYGGIYVPTLAALLIQQKSTINLKGVAVGNGCMEHYMNINSKIYYAYYHGLIGINLWSNLQSACNCVQYPCNFSGNSNANCQSAINQVDYVYDNLGLNKYSIYMTCDGGIPPHLTDHHKFLDNKAKNYIDKHENRLLFTSQKDLKSGKTSLLSTNLDCLNSTAETNYLRLDAVKDALHIAKDTSQPWTVCSDIVNYTSTYTSMAEQLKTIVKSHRVLVYNGDTDSVCNFLGDQWLVESLGQASKGDRRAWIYNNQIAGYVKEFDQITYMTVKGAGHMVPQWKPPQALQMITNFLQGKPQ